MKQLDESSYQMFKAVRDFMNKNKLIWQQNLLIVGCMNDLETNITIIKNASQELMNEPKYITISKKSLRVESNELAFIIKEGLRLYYTINNMSEDMLTFTFPSSRFTLMTDGNFYMEATHIVELAETLSAGLIPIGVTPDKTAMLKGYLQEFRNKPPEREFLLQKRAKLVKLIPKKVKETNWMLKNKMDALVKMYNTKENKEFLSLYKDWRQRIEKPGRRKHYTVLVKGRAIDAETKAFLSEVNIEAGAKKKKVITDAEGLYKVKIYNKDADTITFTKEGYEILTLNIPKANKTHEASVNASLIRLLGD